MVEILNFSGITSSLPRGNFATAMARAPFSDIPLPFDQLPKPLRGMKTRMVYIHPDGTKMHNLAGTHAGIEGTRMATQVYGEQQWPFQQILVNSPYIFGAQIMRQNIAERRFHFGIVIGGTNPPMTEYQYRMAEDYWWSGQDESNDGFFGCYTRTSGWRWIPVRPDQTVATPQQTDPTAFGNNVSTWEITWLASRPYFTKPARMRTFQASTGTLAPAPASLLTGVTPGLGSQNYYWGHLPLANAGDLPAYVQYYVTSPGQAVVQDNSSNRLVPLPSTVPSVGTFRVDTEPGQRTLTADNDPRSNLAFDLIRQSQILDFLLGDLTSGSVPLQLQFQNRFIYTIPPKSEVTLTVGHSNPNGVIVAMLPQRYKRGH